MLSKIILSDTFTGQLKWDDLTRKVIFYLCKGENILKKDFDAIQGSISEKEQGLLLDNLNKAFNVLSSNIDKRKEAIRLIVTFISLNGIKNEWKYARLAEEFGRPERIIKAVVTSGIKELRSTVSISLIRQLLVKMIQRNEGLDEGPHQDPDQGSELKPTKKTIDELFPR